MKSDMTNKNEMILSQIKTVAREAAPKGSLVLLFGLQYFALSLFRKDVICPHNASGERPRKHRLRGRGFRKSCGTAC